MTRSVRSGFRLPSCLVVLSLAGPSSSPAICPDPLSDALVAYEQEAADADATTSRVIDLVREALQTISSRRDHSLALLQEASDLLDGDHLAHYPGTVSSTLYQRIDERRDLLESVIELEREVPVIGRSSKAEVFGIYSDVAAYRDAATTNESDPCLSLRLLDEALPVAERLSGEERWSLLSTLEAIGNYARLTGNHERSVEVLRRAMSLVDAPSEWSPEQRQHDRERLRLSLAETLLSMDRHDACHEMLEAWSAVVAQGAKRFLAEFPNRACSIDVWKLEELLVQLPDHDRSLQLLQSLHEIAASSDHPGDDSLVYGLHLTLMARVGDADAVLRLLDGWLRFCGTVVRGPFAEEVSGFWPHLLPVEAADTLVPRLSDFLRSVRDVVGEGGLGDLLLDFEHYVERVCVDPEGRRVVKRARARAEERGESWLELLFLKALWVRQGDAAERVQISERLVYVADAEGDSVLTAMARSALDVLDPTRRQTADEFERKYRDAIARADSLRSRGETYQADLLEGSSMALGYHLLASGRVQEAAEFATDRLATLGESLSEMEEGRYVHYATILAQAHIRLGDHREARAVARRVRERSWLPHTRRVVDLAAFVFVEALAARQEGDVLRAEALLAEAIEQSWTDRRKAFEYVRSMLRSIPKPSLEAAAAVDPGWVTPLPRCGYERRTISWPISDFATAGSRSRST